MDVIRRANVMGIESLGFFRRVGRLNVSYRIGERWKLLLNPKFLAAK